MLLDAASNSKRTSQHAKLEILRVLINDSAVAAAQMMNPPKVSLSGSVKDMKFCDDETAFWQMASQHSQLHHAYSGSCHPHLGAHP